MQEDRKNISSGAQKAENLAGGGRGDGGEESARQTASLDELKSNSPVADDGGNGRNGELAKDARAAKAEARSADREAAAAKNQAERERRRRERAEKRAEKHKGGRAPGFGGWLAAVIALSTACLALATIVTYGWINMSAMQGSMAGMQTRSLYELNAIVDNLDSNLSKARVATSPRDRTKLLSDIAIESELAEAVLERLPLDGSATGDMAAFINKMGDSARSMLYAAADGGELSKWQQDSLEYMYATNLKLKRALNEATAQIGQRDVEELLRDKGGALADSFSDIKNNVIEEPRGIFDGPFAESAEDINISYFDGMEEISRGRAEELAAELFADYGVTETRCNGETKARGLELYNVELETDDGGMLAQFSKKGGKLVMFDSYKSCADHNFSVERCTDIAQQFLMAAGYVGLKPVWTSENGTTCNINFCPEQDGAVLYPDMIKVKVCEERGIVTGAEATSYVMNHSQRDMAGATVTEESARSVIDGRIEVNSSRLALIPLNDEECLCYEFGGTFDGRDYFVYVDAQTCEEVQVLTVIGTAQGRAIL